MIGYFFVVFCLFPPFHLSQPRRQVFIWCRCGSVFLKMVSLPLTTAPISSSASNFTIHSYHITPTASSRDLPFPRKQQRNLLLFAAKYDSKLVNWNQIELKLGKLIGENPELTLPKIKDRKLNPEKAPNTSRHPNVILWKTTTFEEDNMSSNLSFKPNLSLRMGNEDDKERFSDMILVRNSEPLMKNDDANSTNNIKENPYLTVSSISDLDDTDNTSRKTRTEWEKPGWKNQNPDGMGKTRTEWEKPGQNC
ncbi:hypothetical protein LXL04_008088 [Taraxacum kok-saghyz]